MIPITLYSHIILPSTQHCTLAVPDYEYFCKIILFLINEMRVDSACYLRLTCIREVRAYRT